MKRGIGIFIVAVVAIATNVGLHAAFGWGRHGHWRNHQHGYNGGCGCQESYQEENSCSGHRNHVAPWHNSEQDHNSVQDTVTK